MNNTWREGNEVGCLYRLEEEDLDRVGNCWMKGRLKSKDLVLCTKHSGDCFNTYVLIEDYSGGLQAILGSEFGAYKFGSKLKWQISVREFHLLLAGEFISYGE